MSRKFRNLLFRVHLWLGLHLSIFFTFMFLTGTLIVAGVELESIGRPAIWTTIAKEDRTASFGTIYDSIKSTHPSSTVFVIEKYPAPWFVDRSYGITGWGENVNFWTDPTTGDPLYETGDPSFRDIIRGLHDSFLTGETLIQILICATSVLLLAQIISGLISYRRFWRGFFRWPDLSGGFRSWVGSFHRLMAVWAAPLLVLIALTSFYFMLEDLGLKGSTATPQPPVARETALPAGFDATFIDQAEARVRTAFPDFEPITVILPGNKFASLDFIGHPEGGSKLWGETTVSVDPATLDILGMSTPDDNSGLARWRHLMDMLHYGHWGGTFSMVLWVLLGLAATCVAFSGALIFAARRDPEGSDHGAFRRIWRGMGIFRWAYLLLLLGILFVSYQRLGPNSYQAAVVRPVDAPSSLARLILHTSLRRGTPLDIEMLIDEPDIETVSVTINGGAAQPVDLMRNGETAQTHFRFEPDNTENEIIARLIKKEGDERTVTFRMGSPIW